MSLRFVGCPRILLDFLEESFIGSFVPRVLLHLMGKGKVKVPQLCLTLDDTMDYTVHGILQGRIMEGVAFPFSRGSLDLSSLFFLFFKFKFI